MGSSREISNPDFKAVMLEFGKNMTDSGCRWQIKRVNFIHPRSLNVFSDLAYLIISHMLSEILIQMLGTACSLPSCGRGRGAQVAALRWVSRIPNCRHYYAVEITHSLSAQPIPFAFKREKRADVDEIEPRQILIIHCCTALCSS